MSVRERFKNQQTTLFFFFLILARSRERWTGMQKIRLMNGDRFAVVKRYPVFFLVHSHFYHSAWCGCFDVADFYYFILWIVSKAFLIEISWSLSRMQCWGVSISTARPINITCKIVMWMNSASTGITAQIRKQLFRAFISQCENLSRMPSLLFLMLQTLSFLSC